MKKNINPWPFPKPLDISDAVMSAAARGHEHMALVKATNKHNTDTYREELLNDAKIMGVGIVHIYDKNYAYGGLTIAFKKCSEFPSGVMVEVAVATCSRKDMFNKKIGVVTALEKFNSAMTIELPIARNVEDRDLSWAVKQAFEALYAEI